MRDKTDSLRGFIPLGQSIFLSTLFPIPVYGAHNMKVFKMKTDEEFLILSFRCVL